MRMSVLTDSDSRWHKPPGLHFRDQNPGPEPRGWSRRAWMEGTTPTPARWGDRHTTRIPPNVHAAHAYREPGGAQGTTTSIPSTGGRGRGSRGRKPGRDAEGTRWQDGRGAHLSSAARELEPRTLPRGWREPPAGGARGPLPTVSARGCGGGGGSGRSRGRALGSWRAARAGATQAGGDAPGHSPRSPRPSPSPGGHCPLGCWEAASDRLRARGAARPRLSRGRFAATSAGLYPPPPPPASRLHDNRAPTPRPAPPPRRLDSEGSGLTSPRGGAYRGQRPIRGEGRAGWGRAISEVVGEYPPEGRGLGELMGRSLRACVKSRCRVRVWSLGLCARPGWNLGNKSISTVRVIEGNFVSRYTSASVWLHYKSHKVPDLLECPKLCQPLSWFTSAPVCPRVRVLLWLAVALGVETGKRSILYSVWPSWARARPVTQLCLPCQRLAEQTVVGLVTPPRTVSGEAWAGASEWACELEEDPHSPPPSPPAWRGELPVMQSPKKGAASHCGRGRNGVQRLTPV